MENKKIRVNISLSESTLLSIDKHARIQGLTRSAYISQLEDMENYRDRKALIELTEDNDYYYDLPLINPRLKAIFDE